MTFTGSTDTGIFNYDVIADFGPNLVFDPKLPGAYEAYYFVNGSTKKEIRPVNIIKHVGSNNKYKKICCIIFIITCNNNCIKKYSNKVK